DLRVDTEQLAFAGVRLIGLPAVRTERSYQPLRQHAQQGRRQQEGLDAHVHQASDRADGTVGVHGRQHQVAGERGLHRDLGCLAVTYLADHYHVRVLAQDRTQAARESHVDLAVDLRLANALQVILDRIFDREDVARAGVQTDQ